MDFISRVEPRTEKQIKEAGYVVDRSRKERKNDVSHFKVFPKNEKLKFQKTLPTLPGESNHLIKEL